MGRAGGAGEWMRWSITSRRVEGSTSGSRPRVLHGSGCRKPLSQPEVVPPSQTSDLNRATRPYERRRAPAPVCVTAQWMACVGGRTGIRTRVCGFADRSLTARAFDRDVPPAGFEPAASAFGGPRASVALRGRGPPRGGVAGGERLDGVQMFGLQATSQGRGDQQAATVRGQLVVVRAPGADPGLPEGGRVTACWTCRRPRRAWGDHGELNPRLPGPQPGVHIRYTTITMRVLRTRGGS
jgi:hypothetical protein